MQCSKLFICMRSSQAFDLGVGESLRFWEMKLTIRTRRDIRVQISRSIAKSKMWISISKSGFPNQEQTLEFVPEEARLLIADEDDQFIFQIRWQMGPAHMSRLQQPGVWAYYLRQRKFCTVGDPGRISGSGWPPPPLPPPVIWRSGSATAVCITMYSSSCVNHILN